MIAVTLFLVSVNLLGFFYWTKHFPNTIASFRGLASTIFLLVLTVQIRSVWKIDKNVTVGLMYLSTTIASLSAFIFFVISFLVENNHQMDFLHLSSPSTTAMGDFFIIIRTIWFVVVETLVCLFWLQHHSSNAIESRLQQEKLKELLKEKDVLIENLIKTNTLIHSGALSAGISHELNQFLAVIRLNAEQANISLKTSLDSSTISANLNRIIKVNQSASEVIANLKRLFITTEDSAKQVSVKEIIYFVVALHEKRISESSIHIDLNLCSEDNIHLIKELIQQVLSNLLINAIEALEASAQTEKTINIRTAKNIDSFVITVSDNGPGIAQHLSEKIFDLFETTKSSGTGIGLWLSQHIVTRHEGKLSYDSNYKGGASFTVTLPLTAS